MAPRHTSESQEIADAIKRKRINPEAVKDRLDLWIASLESKANAANTFRRSILKGEQPLEVMEVLSQLLTINGF